MNDDTDANLDYRADGVVSVDDAVALYSSVGWSAYTRDPERLVRAIQHSLRVVTCWHAGQLVGLARVVGDGITIVYLQDVLVDPRFQRRGIGARLLSDVFAPFAEVRQHVLITDDEPAQRAFYESVGFTEVRDMTGGELRAFVRFA